MSGDVTRFWCEHALTDTADDRRTDAGVVVTVEADTITTVDRGVAAPADAVRLDGLTLPGIANAHSHAFHRALRGRTHGERGTFWTWRAAMYDLAARLDPDGYEELATATFAEMLLGGYTAVGEFHYLHHGAEGVPYADPNEMGRRLLRAAERAGIRITLLDACYLHGGIGRPLEPVQRRFADADADAWAARVDELLDAESATATVGAAVHSVRAVDPAAIETVAGWADRRGRPLHAHVSEQPQENADCLAAHGVTPVRLLAERGALGERFTAVHATHLSPDDVALLGGSGCACCVCPTTERDLADGIGPTAALVDAGAGLCVGSDSHAVIDAFEEVRAVEHHQRLSSLQRGVHRPDDLLQRATVDGAARLGWRAGRLAPGWLADFVTVDLDGPRLAGSGDDLLAAALFAATAADVRHVVVGGRHVVRDGRHHDVDVAAALHRSIESVWRAA